MAKILYQVKLQDGLKKGLAQRDLVNEVVLDYFKKHPTSTLADLQQSFPLRVQKKLEIVADEAEAHRLNASRKQYHIFEQVKLADGKVIAICNQWGVANIDNFLDHARQMGYQIGLDGEGAVASTTIPKAVQNTKPTHDIDCYNGQKGRMAIIDKTIYFVEDKIIYSVPMNGKTKAKKILDVGRSFRAEYVSDFEQIHAWNGKIYFYSYFDGDVPKLGFCPRGVFSFEPSTKEVKLFVDGREHFGLADISAMSEGKAYGVCTRDNQFVTLDLNTGRTTKLPMPSVTRQLWQSNDCFGNAKVLGVGYTARAEEELSRWGQLSICSGYAYINPSSIAYEVLYFPLDNPDMCGHLPLGVLHGAQGSDKFTLAASGNVLMTALYKGGKFLLCALSSDGLYHMDIRSKNNVEFEVNYTDWNQYGDFLAIASRDGNQNPLIFKISDPQFLGRATSGYEYAHMKDVIIINDIVYAVNKWNLYCIPNNKLFLKDTDLDSLAQELF